MKNILLLLLVLFGMYGCWKAVYPSGSFRYKMTLAVDDNGKQIVASSVREIFMQAEPHFPEGSDYIKLTGEAIVVDLGEKGKFFALLKSDTRGVDYGYLVAFVMFKFPNLYKSAASYEGIRFYQNLKAKRELPSDMLSILVRFRDIKDPKTVELVDPNDLEKTFGKGVKLVSATIETTDEAVTRRIEKQLGWLKAWREYGGTITGKFYSDNPRPEEILISRDFIQG